MRKVTHPLPRDGTELQGETPVCLLLPAGQDSHSYPRSIALPPLNGNTRQRQQYPRCR